MASGNFKVHTGFDDAPDYAVYGNVAYDLNALPKREQEDQSRSESRTKARAYAAYQPAQGISFFAAAGFVLFAVMMVFVLLARLQLTQISDETAQIESRIADLSEVEARLKIEYEKTFNLTEIEKYATKKLGMIRQGSDSVTFLSMTNVDRAEILVPEDTESTGFLTGFKEFLSSLLEYF